MTETSPTYPKPRRGNPFAWFVLALSLALAGTYMFFSLRNGHFDWTLLAFAGFPLTGALIIYRQPRNRVGWTLAVFGIFNLLSNASTEYAYFGLITMPGSLPFCDFIAWVGAWCWLVAQPFAIATILLFPDGKPPSRRWWVLAWGVLAVFLPILIYLMVLLWPFRGARLVQLDLEVAFTTAVWQSILRIFSIWNPVYIGGMALAVIAMAIRFTRSRGIERQQLKWIFFAMVLVPFSIVINGVALPNNLPLLAVAAQILNVLSIIGFPVAVAFAVTRYHLYDIDVIIRRTLLYGVLTVTLSLFYFGSVILFQSILTGVTGGQSPVSIVLSTLLIAALFSPLRAVFQRAIDRRFYRGKYNSEQIMERLSARLRSEVDLDAINHHLLSAVDESLQPVSSNLWLVSTPKSKL